MTSRTFKAFELTLPRDLQVGSVAVRAASSGTTGGFGNFIVSTLELVAAIVVTILAIVLPIICFVAVLWIVYKMVSTILKSPLFFKRNGDLSIGRSSATSRDTSASPQKN